MTLMQTLEARDLFDQLGKEDEQPERKIEIKPGTRLEVLLIKEFERILDLGVYYDDGPQQLGYPRFPDNISADAIEAFSIGMKAYEGGKNRNFLVSSFLNDMIGMCKQKEIVIHTAHLDRGLDNLCIDLREKHVTIKGNAGYHLGSDMKSGRIHIYGNAGNQLGSGMSGGEIIIEGNVGYHALHGMVGGIVRIQGEIAELERLGSCARAGDVYHKGRLIMKDGRRIT